MAGHRSNKMDVDETMKGNEENEKGDQGKDEAVDMLERLSRDYSTYLEIDASKEKNKFGETIEDMLTKLDEFGSLVDMIRSDSTLCLTSTLPKIQRKQAEIQAMFDKIDRLEINEIVIRLADAKGHQNMTPYRMLSGPMYVESNRATMALRFNQAFVSVVRENTAMMEECVNRAEDEMGSFSGLKKMLSSFVSPKRSQTKDNQTASFTPPKIFITDEYFPKQSSQEDNPRETTENVKPERSVKPAPSTAS